MVLWVRYPRGEVACAIGYPVQGFTVRVDVLPRGPEACYRDEVLCDYTKGDPYPVLEIVSGPRHPTFHVRLTGFDLGARDLWMDARDEEGWDTRVSDDEEMLIYVCAMREGMDPLSLVTEGVSIVS